MATTSAKKRRNGDAAPAAAAPASTPGSTDTPHDGLEVFHFVSKQVTDLAAAPYELSRNDAEARIDHILSSVNLAIVGTQRDAAMIEMQFLVTGWFGVPSDEGFEEGCTWCIMRFYRREGDNFLVVPILFVYPKRLHKALDTDSAYKAAEKLVKNNREAVIENSWKTRSPVLEINANLKIGRRDPFTYVISCAPHRSLGWLAELTEERTPAKELVRMFMDKTIVSCHE